MKNTELLNTYKSKVDDIDNLLRDYIKAALEANNMSYGYTYAFKQILNGKIVFSFHHCDGIYQTGQFDVELIDLPLHEFKQLMADRYNKNKNDLTDGYKRISELKNKIRESSEWKELNELNIKIFKKYLDIAESSVWLNSYCFGPEISDF